MAKKITGYIKLQIEAGKANPAPPVGPALGQHGVNIMDFCKQFNAKTQDQPGMIISSSNHCLCGQKLFVHYKDTTSSSIAKESSRIGFRFRRTKQDKGCKAFKSTGRRNRKDKDARS